MCMELGDGYGKNGIGTGKWYNIIFDIFKKLIETLRINQTPKQF